MSIFNLFNRCGKPFVNPKRTVILMRGHVTVTVGMDVQHKDIYIVAGSNAEAAGILLKHLNYLTGHDGPETGPIEEAEYFEAHTRLANTTNIEGSGDEGS